MRSTSRATLSEGNHGREEEAEETVSLSDLGLGADDAGEAGRAPRCWSSGPPCAATASAIEARRPCGRREDRRLPLFPEAPLMTTLVYVETTRVSLSGPARGAGKVGAARRRDVSAVLLGSGVEEMAEAVGEARGVARPRGRRPGARERLSRAAGRCVSPSSSSPKGSTTLSSAASVLAADVAVPGSPSLDAGLNWDLVDLGAQGREAGRQAPGPRRLRDRPMSVGSRSRASPLSAPGPSSPPRPAVAPSVKIPVEIQDFSKQAVMVEQAHEESQGPSIEDADVIVAGRRGLGGPEDFARRGSRQGARRSSRRDPRSRRWTGTCTPPSRPDRKDRLAQAHRVRHLRRDPAQGPAQGSGDDRRRHTKDPNEPIFDYSDLAVVGDVHEIVPKLTELVKERKGFMERQAGRLPASLRSRTSLPSPPTRRMSGSTSASSSSEEGRPASPPRSG